MRRLLDVVRIVLLGTALAGLALAVSSSPFRGLPAGAAADRILIEKSARRLTLLNNGKPLKVYRVALGNQPIGDKERQGDSRTPEGLYTIDRRNPKSRFHLALHISYPRPNQIARARRRRVSPGGDIMIHGTGRAFAHLGPLHGTVDWTDGCVAVTNREIEEIWRAVPNGTPVEIRP